MKDYKVEINLCLSDEAYSLDWIFKAIEEQLERGESLTGRWKEIEDTTPKFEPAQEEE